MPQGFDMELARVSDPAFLPDLFVQVVEAMSPEGHVPPYLLYVDWVVTGERITDEGLVHLHADGIPEAPDKPGIVPTIALDGRIAMQLLSQWAGDVQAQMASVSDGLTEVQDREIKLAIAYGYDSVLGRLGQAVIMTQAAVASASAAQIPFWTDLGGTLMVPALVVMPATLLVEWAHLYVDSASLEADGKSSARSGQMQGVVVDYAAMVGEQIGTKKTSPWAWVGVAALTIAFSGMIAAMFAGRRPAARKE